LHEVVDATLDDEQIGARKSDIEARGDLVGALAVHAVVAKVEASITARRPPLPLAPLVGDGADSYSDRGVGIPQGRARGDRVAEAGDDDRFCQIRGVQ
jgi:hypothetical protein